MKALQNPRPRRDLVDDETAAHIEIVITKLRNLKRLVLDAYRTENNLSKEQK